MKATLWSYNDELFPRAKSLTGSFTDPGIASGLSRKSPLCPDQEFSKLFDGDRFTNAGCTEESYLMVQLNTKVKIRLIQLVGVSNDPTLGPFLSGKCPWLSGESSFNDNTDPDRWPEEEGTKYYMMTVAMG